MTLAKTNSHDFPVFWNEFFGDDWPFINGQKLKRDTPKVNIKENEDRFLIELVSPGLSKDDFNISIDNDLLTISSEIKNEETDENEKYTRREYSFSSFSRSFTLPETVNADQISATYEGGILKLSIPKKEEAKPKPAKRIEIQ